MLLISIRRSQGAMHLLNSETKGMLTVRKKFKFVLNTFIDAVVKGDGRKIEGHRVIVDRELGRTRNDWLPRRLGGGKGD